MSNTATTDSATFDELFSTEKSWPFNLLLLLLIFNSFRPDKLLPGGSVLTYFPTLIIALLLLKWLPLKNKVLSNTQTRFYFFFILLMICQLPFVRNYGYAKGIVESTLIYGITSYLFAIQFIDNFTRINLYVRLYAILGVFFAILGLSGGGRVDVPVLGDENDFCLYVNCLIPFAYYLGKETRELWKKMFYYGMTVAFVAANVATFSRGGFLGLIAVSIYIFIQSRNKGSVVILISIVAAAILFWAPAEYLEEIGSIDMQSYQRDTGAQRIDSWKAGWKMFMDNPAFGVGVNNFGPWLPDYWEGLRQPSQMWGRAAHSLYISLLSEMGIVGTLFFAGMIWRNIKDHSLICNMEKNKERLIANSNLASHEKENILSGVRQLYFFSHAFSGALVAYLATGIFISVLWYEYFWKLTALWVATSNLAGKIVSILEKTKKNKEIIPENTSQI